MAAQGLKLWVQRLKQRLNGPEKYIEGWPELLHFEGVVGEQNAASIILAKLGAGMLSKLHWDMLYAGPVVKLLLYLSQRLQASASTYRHLSCDSQTR